MAETTYVFGAISPVTKARLGYDQRQVAALGVAKNLGGCLGLLAGALSAARPAWVLAPRRTPSATAGSGSSSPAGRRRCPSAWYGELQFIVEPKRGRCFPELLRGTMTDDAESFWRYFTIS